MKAFLIGDKPLSDRLLGDSRVQSGLFRVMNRLPDTITFGVLAGTIKALMEGSLGAGMEYGFMMFAVPNVAFAALGAWRPDLPPKAVDLDEPTVLPAPRADQAPAAVETIHPQGPAKLRFKLGNKRP